MVNGYGIWHLSAMQTLLPLMLFRLTADRAVQLDIWSEGFWHWTMNIGIINVRLHVTLIIDVYADFF